MDSIKEAFSKVKEDTDSLKQAINILSDEIIIIRNQLNEINRTIQHIQQTNQQTDRQDNALDSSFQQPEIYKESPNKLTEPQNINFKSLKTPNIDVSSGNKGVPTDRQTNQQTDRQTNPRIESISPKLITSQKAQKMDYSQILESINLVKNDLRSKFISLTDQEFIVFSNIYQLEEQGISVDYPLLANRLSLSQSSVRDYILKITNKGITINKIKEKNKKVFLSIPPELKKIVSLDTLSIIRNR